MGSILGGAYEQPVHEVTVADFYIGRCEVTGLNYRLPTEAEWE